MEGYGDKESSTSPSRLSPFAQPFSPQPTLNSLANSSQQPFAPSLDGSHNSDPSSSLLGSFSDLTLEGDSEFNVPWDAYDYCGHLSDMALMDFPCDNPPDFNYDGQSYLCPKDSTLALEGNRMLAVSYDPDIAAALPSSKCLMPNYTQNLLGISNVSQRVDSGKVAQRVSSGDWLCNMEQDKKKDHERSFFWNEGSSACESLQKQATGQPLQVAERLKASSESSDNMHGKMTSMILGGDKQIKSRGTKRVNAESFQDSNFRLTSFKFSSPSDMRSVAAPQNGPQGQWSYPMPAITRSSGNLDVGSHERSISLNSSSAAHAISPSTEKISGSALSFGSPGISTNLSAFNPVPSVNGNFSCFNAINNNENSRGCNSEKFSALPVFDPIHLKESHVLLNAKGKEVCQDKSLTEKGSEKKSDKTVSDDGRDPLLLATSKLQSLVIKPGVSVQNSSKMLDENDSDLDSPIWKGTLASSQFPFGVSGSASSKCFCKELETSTSLNPLAPQFFPSKAKGSTYYHKSGCGRNDFSSFHNCESSAVSLTSREPTNVNSAKVGTNPCGSGNGIANEYSNDIREAEKEYALVNTSRSSSFFNSAHIVQPSPLGDYFRSNLRLALGTNAEGSLRGIKDVVHGGSERVPVLAKEHVLSPSSSGVGLITDVTETRQDVSMSLSTPPKRDAQILINAMHDLSELLVQNCSNCSYSLNGYEYDIIQHVINNLYAFSMNRVGQRTPMPESTQTGTLYSPNKSTEHCKSSSMELRVAWTKTMALPQESENNSYHEGKKSCHTGITEKELDSFSSCSGVGAEKSNDIIQVMTNILGENQQIEEDMHQQALVYRDLWLKAEAALCALKYKTCALSMKFDGMDRCKSIQKC